MKATQLMCCCFCRRCTFSFASCSSTEVTIVPFLSFATIILSKQLLHDSRDNIAPPPFIYTPPTNAVLVQPRTIMCLWPSPWVCMRTPTPSSLLKVCWDLFQDHSWRVSRGATQDYLFHLLKNSSMRKERFVSSFCLLQIWRDSEMFACKYVFAFEIELTDFLL